MNTSLMVKTALIAAFTAATAVVAIPIGPVPVTLQVFFVLLAGLVLGPAYGALSMVIYMLIGLVGLPVFAGGKSGLGALFSTSGGYIFGFVAAAAVIGLIVSRGGESTVRLVVAMAAGIAVIYAFGVTQLSIVADMTWAQAFTVGAAPFIIFDMIKAVAAIAIARRIGFAVAQSDR